MPCSYFLFDNDFHRIVSRVKNAVWQFRKPGLVRFLSQATIRTEDNLYSPDILN